MVNLKSSKDYINNHSIYFEYNLITIEFCEKCLSYIICSLRGDKCNKCKECFCAGCSSKIQKVSEYNYEDTLYLKVYLKLFYLRTINKRSEFVRTCAYFHIMHIIFCLFLTPLYFGFISNFMCFLAHKNKKRIMEELSNNKIISYFFYSFLRGLLMFPYIILFFPFMIILLFPGIFSYKYYLYAFIMYVTAICPRMGALRNVEYN